MAILRDEHFEDSQTEVEFSLYPDKIQYHPERFKWVFVHLRFLFGGRFPEISIRRNGQDEKEIEYLITELRRLAEGEIPGFEFEPTEPDYTMTIVKEAEDNYSVRILIDAGGASGSVYASSGPAVLLSVNGEGLRRFAEELSAEFAKLTKNDEPQKNLRPADNSQNPAFLRLVELARKRHRATLRLKAIDSLKEKMKLWPIDPSG